MWQGWINGILGVYLFIVAFIGYGETGNMWNSLIVGIIAAIAGFLMVKEKPWEGWICGIVGVWLIIAAFIPSVVGTTANTLSWILSGLLLMISGFAALGKEVTTTHHGGAHAH